MALRPIDGDAIPVPVVRDRPLKQAKVAIDIHRKQFDCAVNDENSDRLPPRTDTVIDYVFSGDLKAITDPEVKIQLLQLLLKSSQDKRFVCEEADKALNSMVQHVSPIPLLRKLLACVSHSNLRVRAKAASSISNCLTKMKPEELNKYGLVSLVQMAAESLNDKLPEARQAARSIVMLLHESFVGDHEDQKLQSWQSFCQIKFTISARSVPSKNYCYEVEIVVIMSLEPAAGYQFAMARATTAGDWPLAFAPYHIVGLHQQ
ncbi:hypothetical protein Nepgr_020621 [Nepenthes gracilis]|uniref:TOG domain-containing protein n=1 Tax=Nepenthes gracilis TaxID=150966 RepID=A0AAD3XWF7_NEPGR|nr:hypothetical protein Nepgr_020621 [Nepenthes gracilis]